MAGVPPESLKAYFENARTFDQERLAAALRSRKLAWIIASCSMVMAVAGVGAVAALSPLKTVSPFVIRVDNSTGVVDVMTAITDGKETYTEVVSKYFLTQYVIYRESYIFAETAESFRRVSLMSSVDEQRRFAEGFNAQNPESPQIVYGRRDVASVTIKGISFLEPGVAQIRFFRTVRPADGDGRDAKRTDFTSTISFVYLHKNIPDSVRLVNPLGFTVTNYRLDRDVAQ